MKPSLAVMLLALALPSPALALTLQELLTSSATHYPTIEKARAGLESGRGRIQAAQGAFDWRLDNKSVSRADGFYSGDYTDSQVTRRLADSNTRVFAGYRASDGTFPVYEEQNQTLSGGEFNAGLALALWRDRIIDEDRFQFTDANLELKQRGIDLLLTQMGVQYDAMLAYIEWVAAGQALKVTQNMLKLATDRQEGFSERAKGGNLADIVLTENQQYIAKRQADVNDAKRDLENKAAKLSLYWRDKEGKSISPTMKDLPKDFPKTDSFDIDLNTEIERARSIRPDLIRIDVGMQRERNKLMLNEQKIMPKVDLVAEGSRDTGGGANRFRGSEAKIGLNISIPLQQNLGEGQMRQSRAALRQLEEDRRLLNDQIATEIQMAANNYSAARKNVVQAQKEIDATKAMQVADRERFDSGATDFFVLNMREERNADAQIKQISARLKLWRAIADYYLASLQAEKLGVNPEA